MELTTLILLSLTAFIAGFVDAIVGGGGLIQTPMALILMPTLPVATLIGSLKIPSFTGTLMAAILYFKHLKINWKLLFLMIFLAIPAAFFGSMLLSVVNNDFMKPVLFIVLVILLFYTISRKNFGQQVSFSISKNKKYFLASLVAVVIGFYDGFIGPGTGSFLVLSFIFLLGFDFLNASANAKMVNLATNIGSIVLFLSKGKIIWLIAVPMAICNALGGYLGAKLAINQGNKFIRVFFLIVVFGTLIRFGYDIFYK